MLELVSMKILVQLYEKGELRHKELSKLTKSRGTLGLSLKDLEDEGLIQRKVIGTKPIQTFYSLTEKGCSVAKELYQIQLVICQQPKSNMDTHQTQR
jgi:Predicted transcriptional regulators